MRTILKIWPASQELFKWSLLSLLSFYHSSVIIYSVQQNTCHENIVIISMFFKEFGTMFHFTIDRFFSFAVLFWVSHKIVLVLSLNHFCIFWYLLEIFFPSFFFFLILLKSFPEWKVSNSQRNTAENKNFSILPNWFL